MIKHIEKMQKLDKGTSFQAARFNVIHKNIAKVQTDTFLRGFISSPEPSGSQGELIVYPCSVVRPSVRRPSVVHHFQRSSSLKQLGQSKPNFT